MTDDRDPFFEGNLTELLAAICGLLVIGLFLALLLALIGVALYNFTGCIPGIVADLWRMLK